VHTGNGVAPGDRRDQDTVQEDQQTAQDLTKFNEQAVADATEADHTAKGWLAKLTPAATGLEQEVTGSDNTVAADAIPDGDTSPSKVHKWWDSLNPAQQESVLHDHPGKIGGLDGVPVAARDRANRETFAADYANVKTRVTELGEQEDLQPTEQTEYDKLKSKFKGMDAIQDRLEGHKLGKESYLMKSLPRATAVGWSQPVTRTRLTMSSPRCLVWTPTSKVWAPT